MYRLWIAIILAGWFSAAIADTTTVYLTNPGPGPRGTALGGYSVIANDAPGLWANPAGPAWAKKITAYADPYLKIGDRVLFDVKSIDQWVEKHLIREKEWKRQELKPEIEKGNAGDQPEKESDFLDMLDK